MLVSALWLRMGQEYTAVRIRKADKPRFEQAKEAVAREIGEKPTQDETVRELVEAYLGGDACGGWQEGEAE